jgi:uncharacterized protein
MKIIVLGAGGNTGRRVVAEVLSRGHPVTAGVRDPARGAPNGVPTVIVDINTPETISAAVAGHDAVVSAIGPSRSDDARILVRAARALLAELPRAEVTRLVVVGGAGPLEVVPGVRLVDTPAFPEALKPLGLAHAEALDVYRAEGAGLDWTYLSPPPSSVRVRGPADTAPDSTRWSADLEVTDTSPRSTLPWPSWRNSRGRASSASASPLSPSTMRRAARASSRPKSLLRRADDSMR